MGLEPRPCTPTHPAPLEHAQVPEMEGGDDLLAGVEYVAHVLLVRGHGAVHEQVPAAHAGRGLELGAGGKGGSGGARGGWAWLEAGARQAGRHG